VQREPPSILTLDPRRPDRAALAAAAAVLRQGRLVIVPTETVYGLAADSRQAGAGERTTAPKGRPDDKPLPVLAVDQAAVAAAGAVFSPPARALAAVYWPGPLTLVLRTPRGFEGFRVPDYPVMRGVLEEFGGLLAVTSANRSGEPPATTVAAALAALANQVELALDAGPSPGGVPSTVVRADGEKIEILRAGAIAAELIWKVAQV